MKALLRRSKDATLEFALRHALNAKLRGIGEIAQLRLNMKNRCLWFEIELAGEKEPVEIEIDRYVIRKNAKSASVTIDRANASREWLDAALRKFVIGRRLSIPSAAAEWIERLT